jgi:TonB-linked SusC/RagA family outer membrane protein
VRSRHLQPVSGALPEPPRVSPSFFSALLVPFCALLLVDAARAQSTGALADPETGTISGIVAAQETGAALPAARVSVVGTQLGVTASSDGRYIIPRVPPGTYRLRARLIGYALTEMTGVVVVAGDTARADFRLAPLAVTLQEVVVVGYGTQTRKDVTGSVISVASADLQRTPTASTVDAVKGRVAGVDIVSTGNKPGDALRVRVRGTRSIISQEANDPLYVLDGIPMAGGIGDLNPNDIESVEVLKDASATAIYGSRGANGVVLITTRQGRAGATSITYETYAGLQQEMRRVRMMNGPEFAEYKREANRTRGQYLCDPGVAVCDSADAKLLLDGTLEALRAGRWTDWQDLVLRPGMQTNHEIRIAGGDDRTRFALSGNQLAQQGILRGQDFKRRSLRLNLDHQLNSRFRIGTSTQLIRSDQDLGRGDGVYTEALDNNPLGMAYTSDGRLKFKPTTDGQRVNPLSDIRNWYDERVRTRVFGTLFADYNLTENLNWRLNFGPDLTFFRRCRFRGAETQARQGSSPDGALWNERTFAYTLDNILTYRATPSSDHRLDATFLYSIQQEHTERDSSEASGLPYEHQLCYDLGSGLNVERVGSPLTEWALQSYMARFNYALKDRYLLTLTGRVDGSSRLAPGQKYALFPSVAVAWRLSEENFVQRTNLFSDLKLRASYGRTGNTAVEPYQTQGSLIRTIYTFGEQAGIGYRVLGLPNPNLRWEKTSQLDVGLEFALANGRLSGSVDFYRAHTKDLLMWRKLPGSTGIDSIVENIGATRNTGFEVALSALLVRDWHGLRWNVDIASATNKNRIVSLVGGRRDDPGNRWFIGQPVEVFYDYKFGGIWQLKDSVEARKYGRVPGQIRVVDVNGDGKIDDQDRVILGTAFPKWTGSVTTRVDWKRFDFSLMTVARLGFMVDNQLRTSRSTLAGRYNNLYVDYWTPTNPSNTEPRPNAAQENPDYGDTRAYEDGSFVRVRNITLGYTVPDARVGGLRVRSLRIYATAIDPFLFTKFRGLDPETRTTTGTPPRIVSAVTPSYRTVLMGLSVSM